MNRLKFTLFLFLSSLLIPQFSSAQLFLWGGSNIIVTQGTPITFTSLVSDVGVLNAAEGKSPVLAFSITHTYVGDLSISLTSPEGTTIDISSGNGGSGDDYISAFFTHNASASITAGSAPFSGDYLPEESFSLFDGENADGVWTLTIEDNGSGDDGTFAGGQLVFNEGQFFSYGLDNSSVDNDGASSNDLLLPSSGINWIKNIHNQANSALEFDGTGYAEVTNQHVPNNAVTFAVWVKPSVVNSDMKVINVSTLGNSYTDLVSLGVLNGQADFEVREDAFGGRVTGGALVAGEWTHIAGTWSTIDGLMHLYVNGELVETGQGPTSLSFDPSLMSPSIIGASSWSLSGYRFEGVMDDIRAYGIAMNEYQIKDIVANYNQYCATAVELPVEGNTCSGNYYAHNYGGNGVNGPATNCSGNSGGASWFTVTVPTSGNLTISSTEVAGSALSDNVIEVYSGTCGNLAYINCEDDVNANFAEVVLTGLTPGEVLHVKSWEFSNDSFGQYAICAFEPSTSVGIEDHTNTEDVAIQVYPNPANNQIQVVAEFNTQEEMNLQIVNILGEVIRIESIGTTKLLNKSIDVSEINNGIYFLNIQGKDKFYTQRFVVKK